VKLGRRVFVLWTVLVLLFVAIYQLVAEDVQPRELSAFIADVERDRVDWVHVRVKGNIAEYAYRIKGASDESPTMVAKGTPSERVEQLLLDHGVRVRYSTQPQESSNNGAGLSLWLPMLFFFVVYTFFLWRSARKRVKGPLAEPGAGPPHPAAGSAPLQVTYMVEARDQFAALLSTSQGGHSTFFFFGLLATGQLFAIGHSIVQGESPSFASSMMLFVFMFLVLTLYVSPRIAYNRLSDAEKQVRFVVNDHGVEVIGGVAESKVGWPGIHKVTEDKRFVLFWTAGRALFLPKRCLSDEQRKQLEPWIAPLKPKR
jgi:YcxB-like protein